MSHPHALAGAVVSLFGGSLGNEVPKSRQQLHWFGAAVAVILTACSGGGKDGSSITAPPPPPPTVSVGIASPISGSTITQTWVGYPNATVTIVAAASSNTSEAISFAWTVDGASVAGNSDSLTTQLSVGSQSVCATASLSSGTTSQPACTSITVVKAMISGTVTVASYAGTYAPQGEYVVVGDSMPFDSVLVGSGGAYSINTRWATTAKVKIDLRGDSKVQLLEAHVPSQFYSNWKPLTVVADAEGQPPFDIDSVYAYVTSSGSDHLPFYVRIQNVVDGAQVFGVGSWPSFPVKVAFFQYPVSTLDSTNMWIALDSINVKAGFTVFAPSDTNTVKSLGGVKAYVSPSFSLSSGSLQGLNRDYTSGEVDLQEISWPAAGMPSGLAYLIGTPIYGLIQGEFMHTLGFGHTCSWVSVLESGCTYVTEGSSPTIQPRDVTYMEWMSHIAALERQLDTRWSIAYIYQAEYPGQQVDYVDASGNIVP